MRKVWMGTAAAAVLGLAAIGGWQSFGGAEVVTPVAPATAQPATEAVPSGATAGAVQLAQNAEQPEIRPDDRVLGSPDAPVTVIEYASLTCPHCARFHTETLPKLKSEYIETGKVRLVYRDFPLDGVALRASMLAACMPEDRYFNMLDVLYRTQSDWARASDPVAALTQLARTAGMSEAAFERCMADEALLDRIVKEFQEGQTEFQVQSTPSFIIDGTKHSGALSFEDFSEILEDQLPNS